MTSLRYKSFSEDTAPIMEQMAKSISALKETAPTDEATRRMFGLQMDSFGQLFKRYIATRNQKIRWDHIRRPSPDILIDFDDIRGDCLEGCCQALLNKLVIVKLNGGLGTTMGCVGPKSVIEVRDELTFLDLTVKQIETLQDMYQCQVPLILMNSFNTHDDTLKAINKYKNSSVRVLTFNQSRHPRILKGSNVPMPTCYDDPKDYWTPPGHGDFYRSFERSGLLKEMLDEGREFCFVSNVDNLGATVDIDILYNMEQMKREFIMEVTPKTMADVKGGTLIEYEGKVKLLELAQVPPENIEDFKSIKMFKIFNTNNIWVNLTAVHRVLEANTLEMDIMCNQKTAPNGAPVIQLEEAIGAAIQSFKAVGLCVPRSRFLPVKNTSDLLAIQVRKRGGFPQLTGCRPVKLLRDAWGSSGDEFAASL
eukprot:TRINITY_DN1053_c0_g1_i2.p1 TRINITY_DN1053_c0_g1~~TRINITY_DN1053_c0_g1_i2.p1  ORF type:complete len:434 (+),score=66.21 TRINITY_DN1053_c0_g1_i2:38-1303(+)